METKTVVPIGSGRRAGAVRVPWGVCDPKPISNPPKGALRLIMDAGKEVKLEVTEESGTVKVFRLEDKLESWEVHSEISRVVKL